MADMKIFLIRHGESVANTRMNEQLGLADHRVYLTEHGKEQARVSAHVLANRLVERKFHLEKENTRVWYSPYDRTRETMEIFDDVIGFSNMGIDIREDIRLTEQQFGLFDSIPKDKWKELFPVQYQNYARFREQKGKFWARLPMGESPFDVAVRMKGFMGTIMRDYQKHGINTLFLFTHGVSLRVFVMQYLHKTVDWYETDKNPGNCWVRMIDGKEDKGYIVL